MLLASSPTAERTLFNSQKVRTLAAARDWSPFKELLLRENQAADLVLGQSPLLRSNLAAYFARHTQLEASHARTYEAQFATADDPQNPNATALEAVHENGRRLLLEAKTQETTARQGSASSVEGSHIESAKLADLCKWRDT